MNLLFNSKVTISQFHPVLEWFIITFSISFLIWLLSILFLTNDETINTNEPFECGLESITSNRSPFCMHFFLVGILFLVFDIELILSLPLVVSSLDLVEWFLFWLTFMSILLLGLFMEVVMGTLDWKE